MVSEVRMPELEVAARRLRVERWLVSEGDAVERGRPLLEVAAEGTTWVIEAPTSGVLAQVLAAPGAVLPVGAVLGRIREAGPAAGIARAGPTRPGGEARRGPDDPEVAASPASPAARRLARELGVDLALVPPSAPGRRITSEDVEAFAAGPAPPSGPAPVEVRTRPWGGRPAESPHPALRSPAPVTLAREAEVGGLVQRHRRLGPGLEAAGVELAPIDLLLEAVAGLLPGHPRLMARPVGDGGALHLGVTVASGRGPVVAVVRDAGSKTLAEIARERSALAARARAGTLAPGEAEGAVLALADLGAHGVDLLATAVESAPCALLGLGRIVDRPVVIEGEIQARPVAWLSLSFDRSGVDDASAAAFLCALAERLAE